MGWINQWMGEEKSAGTRYGGEDRTHGKGTLVLLALGQKEVGERIENNSCCEDSTPGVLMIFHPPKLLLIGTGAILFLNVKCISPHKSKELCDTLWHQT